MLANPYDLERFAAAQDESGTYDQALTELRAGKKRSHWMWFVFPQIAGLGRTSTSQRFAITDLAEARAYLAHPVLGERLRTCARAVAESPTSSASELVGADDVKLRSSMTLFARAAPSETLFQQVLDKYFAGEPDPLTDQILAGQDSAGST